jgi:hypothetical protein
MCDIYLTAYCPRLAYRGRRVPFRAIRAVVFGATSIALAGSTCAALRGLTTAAFDSSGPSTAALGGHA